MKPLRFTLLPDGTSDRAFLPILKWLLENSVIPVRMLEAWLLFDEVAIRKAAGNPGGKCQLNLPNLRRLEEIADPKNELHSVLQQASELTGRRLKKFNVYEKIFRVADLITDFSPLRQLSAFQALETDIQQAICQQKWK